MSYGKNRLGCDGSANTASLIAQFLPVSRGAWNHSCPLASPWGCSPRNVLYVTHQWWCFICLSNEAYHSSLSRLLSKFMLNILVYLFFGYHGWLLIRNGSAWPVPPGQPWTLDSVDCPFPPFSQRDTLHVSLHLRENLCPGLFQKRKNLESRVWPVWA